MSAAGHCDGACGDESPDLRLLPADQLLAGPGCGTKHTAAVRVESIGTAHPDAALQLTSMVCFCSA